MSKNLQQFTGLYQVSQTLRFELKPIGKTAENLEKSGLLAEDNQRAEAYPVVKKFLDGQYKELLQRALLNVRSGIGKFDSGDIKKIKKEYLTPDNDINWELLHQNLKEFLSIPSKERKKGDDPRAQVRKILAMVLTKDVKFAELSQSTPDKFLKSVLKKDAQAEESLLEFLGDDDGKVTKDNLNAIKEFQRFACYFIGFQENRANIFSDEDQNTAAANRAVDENFAKFCMAVDIFQHLQNNYPSIIQEAQTELIKLLKGQQLAEIFAYGAYSKFLAQSGITDYNYIVGGIVPKSGEKIRGINEFINLYKQQHPECKTDRKLGFMPLLFKQILSDRETISFIPPSYANDDELQKAILTFVEDKLGKYENSSICEKPVNVVDELKALLVSLKSENDLFVNAKDLTMISKTITGNWENIGLAMEQYADKNFKTKKDKEKWLKKDYYSFAELQATGKELENNFAITAMWNCPFANGIYDFLESEYPIFISTLKKNDAIPLRERADDVSIIKNYLDTLQDLLHLIKPLYNPENEAGDQSITSRLYPLYEQLALIIPLYNSVRNYMTKKTEETAKIKLKFNNSSLATGWDQNKEKDYTTVIFIKKGLYYLGVMSPNCKTDFTKIQSKPGDDCYQKMIYKYLPPANKMLPHVFFSAKGVEEYKPSDELLAKYSIGKHKKGNDFDLNFCHELIDFFKKSIAVHPDWKNFNFKFSDTEKYQGMDEFYNEIAKQSYKITFADIPVNAVNKLVDEGKLFLFQIYNKDFAPGAHGRPDKSTLYWRALFDPENLKNVVFKLSGGAEIFKRDAGIKTPVIHKTGTKMVNRLDCDGKPIPETIYQEIYNYANGRIKINELSENAKNYQNKAVVKDVTHDIIKDRRFAQEKYLFHVPYVINFNSPSAKFMNINDDVNAYIKNNPDVNIIGIDRGERNLLYATVIDQQGKIISQRSLNTVSRQTYDDKTAEFDYHEKLDQKEKERDDARKTWTDIGKIKDLKAGYLSQIIHELAQMMIEHHAIIVLEDLNFGFKRGRFGVEKQVYQKFEKALIDKLNYLIFKDIQQGEPGGVLHGYQLTNPFQSFEKLGKQSGFLFYVPAGYTSKIDPVTGFVSLFNFNACTTKDKRREFIEKFNKIYYDDQKGKFAFDFNYDNFTDKKVYKNNWCVYSADQRWCYRSNEKSVTEINPTCEIKKALQSAGVKLTDGLDVKSVAESIKDNTKKDIFDTLFYAFKYTVQMRNSNAATGEDYIESPIPDDKGNFFRSGSVKELPKDADANGAYHIALKGLYLIKNCINQGAKLEIGNEAWFKFMQNHEF